MSEPTLICYRGACSRPAHPCGYNRVTHGLYCIGCAQRIERSRPLDQEPFFPLLPRADEVTAGGALRTGRIVIRPQPPEPEPEPVFPKLSRAKRRIERKKLP